MANLSYVTYSGTGTQTDFTFPFTYLASTDVYVFVNGVPANFIFVNASSVRCAFAPPAGTTVQVRRITQKSAAPVNFTDGSILLETDLDMLATYALYIAQESSDLDGRLSTMENTIFGLGGGLPGTVYVQRASGDGTTVAYTLIAKPTIVTNVDVFIGGLYQNHNTFNLNGSLLTFNTAPITGTLNIEFKISIGLTLGSTDAALVSYTPAGTGAVTTSVQAQLRKSPSSASGFWPDAVPAGVIQRFYDRVFIGGATLADGTIANIGKDWLETERLFTTRNSQFVTTSTIGQMAILGGSRTSDSANVGSEGCIGVGGYAINNNTAQLQSSYAGYFEARRKANTGITHGIEIDIVNQGSVIATNPSSSFAPSGMTNALWLASGGGVAGAVNSSVAIGIVNNGAAFVSGIMFQANSIAGTDGNTGTGVAIGMAKGHTLTWFNSAGNQTSYLYSGASSTNLAAGLILDDGRVSFVNTATGSKVFETVFLAGDVNYVGFTGSASGIPANVQACGADANIDIRLAPKGGGVLAVTYGSSPATTPASFVASRKLAFKDGNGILWYIPISTVAW